MKYRLIAMDLDGTLNNDEKKITPRTRDALMAAQAAGIRLALASARPSPGLYKERDALRMQEHRGVLMSYNGGRIVDAATGETLFETSMPMEEARAVLDEIIAKADYEAVNAFGDAVKQAGKASPEGDGNWAKSTFEDLVQYNDGFKTNLIGTPRQIAERIVALKAAGVDLVLSAFLHFHEEVEYFGKHVLPLVRELEQAQAREAA